jgi:iron complex outermembrane receptor protein
VIQFDLATGCQEAANDGPDTTESDGSNFSDNDYKSTIITANFDSGDFLYTYIYTNRDMDEQNMQDFDGAPVHMLRMNFFNDWEQTSHEFRVTSQFSDRVQFIAGFYDWETNFDQRWDVYDLFYQLSRLGNPVWAAGRQGLEGYADVAVWEDDVAGNNGQSQLTTSTALFFSADWYLSDQWTVTAGFRWTEEEKDFVGGASAPGYYPLRGEPWPGIYNPYEAQQKWTETTPKLDVRYQINDDLMAYASYSEGFKSGGFFARQANYLIDPSYDPEYVKNYELGWKTTLMDGRMIFNGAFFRSDYNDKQESILIPVSTANVATVVRNASSMEMNGVELETMIRFNEAFDLMVTYGHLSAEYADYFADLTGSGVITDNSGLVPRNIPENTFGITGSYTVQLGSGDLKARLSYRYRDAMETNSSNFPQGTLDSITNLNGTLTYSVGNYQATIWGRNMTDEREQRWGTIGAITTRGWWNEPATYGFTVSASF